MRRPSPGSSTSRTCPTSTCSSAAPGRTGPATSCSGRRPTPSWSSWTRSGPTSTAGTCGRPARSTPAGNDASAAPEPDASRRPRVGYLAAVGAGADDLQGVADVGEAVLAGDPVGPRLDGGAGDLDGATTAAADQVVVVVGAA